jgi:transposase
MEAAVDRLILSDEQWERVAPHLSGKVGDPGRSAADNRMFVEGVPWLARVGAPWRDLPAEFEK